MVANYKHKRYVEEMARDKSKDLKLEGSERMRAKKLIKSGLQDAEDDFDKQILDDMEFEIEMKKAYDCYLREKADPNYRYTCFQKRDEDDTLESE